MAGKKTQAQLTPEEKLQQALVPTAEQPYKVPANWCWLHLLYSFINCTDSNKKIKQKEYLKEGILPIVDQGKDLIGGFTNNKELAFKGDLPVIIFGDHTRCVKYVDFNFVQGADGVKVLKPQIFYNEKLFYYALKNIDIKNLGYRRHFPTFDQYFVPLPPLDEQQRIVERIESLFAKLDEAKENLQNVLDGFETRKAAILHKAFTGELTANWRKQHGVSMDSWEEKALGDCGSWSGGGTPSMSHKEYWENGNILWITSKDMKTDVIETTQMYTNELGVANSSAKYLDKPSILFVMRSGILRRTLPISMVLKPFTVNQDLKVLTPENIDIKFLFWSCKANEANILKNCMKNGTTVESINYNALLNFKVFMPALDEQTEIVSIIDDLLAKEQQAKELAENVLDKIELIKKSILARAFRGELGTNNPADEPAVELLKRML